MEITKHDIHKVGFMDDKIFIQTKSGEIRSMPIAWFPRLEQATLEQRNDFELTHYGIHWEQIDEDLSYSGFFTFNKDKIENEKTDFQKLLARFPTLNLAELARVANVSPNLMRQYACGAKVPSKARIQKIKQTMKSIGRELASI